ncbi:MAG: hypothetical protein JWM50_1474 [Microbacteriaceae bacterium]|jgi:osmotically-inducible protein OsmY|nr:hypothetical protein [Microbacteriaceae bacterium]
MDTTAGTTRPARPGDDTYCGNVVLAKRVQDCLSRLDGVPAHRIGSTVRQGGVMLSGDVALGYQRDVAEAAVRHLDGVRTVDNRIRVVGATQR